MGDFNINLLHFLASPHSQNFILSLQSHNPTLIIILCVVVMVSGLTAISPFCMLNEENSEILGGNWINWFIRFEYALKTELNYYICIILPTSHVVCLIFLWNLFSFVFFCNWFSFSQMLSGQYSIIIIIVIIQVIIYFPFLCFLVPITRFLLHT